WLASHHHSPAPERFGEPYRACPRAAGEQSRAAGVFSRDPRLAAARLPIDPTGYADPFAYSPFLPAARRPPGGDWCVIAGPAETHAGPFEQGQCHARDLVRAAESPATTTSSLVRRATPCPCREQRSERLPRRQRRP